MVAQWTNYDLPEFAHKHNPCVAPETIVSPYRQTLQKLGARLPRLGWIRTVWISLIQYSNFVMGFDEGLLNQRNFVSMPIDRRQQSFMIVCGIGLYLYRNKTIDLI